MPVDPTFTDMLGVRRVHPDPEIRALRSAAHRAFDRLWRQGNMTRREAYLWLASELGTPAARTHMGMMEDRRILERVVELSDRKYGSTGVADDFPDDLE